MTHLLSTLIVVAMVGILCTSIWELEPAEKVKEAQEIRVEKAAILTFH
jgi:hypothetical protein